MSPTSLITYVCTSISTSVHLYFYPYTWNKKGKEDVFCCYWNRLHLPIILSPNTVNTGNENPIYVFLFWELRGLSPNFHIQVSVSDLYIPRIGPHISCSMQIRQINRGKTLYKNHSQTHECGNGGCVRAIPFLRKFVSNFRYCFFTMHLTFLSQTFFSL